MAELLAKIHPAQPVMYTSDYIENILNDMSEEKRQRCLLFKYDYRAALLQRIAQALKATKE